MKIKIEDIAKICHETNKAYSESIGDYTLVHWEECEKWIQDTIIKCVLFILKNPTSTYSDLHDIWLDERKKGGWVYGKVKDLNKKTNPNLLPYDKLPIEQQFKDVLFKSIVTSFLESGVLKENTTLQDINGMGDIRPATRTEDGSGDIFPDIFLELQNKKKKKKKNNHIFRYGTFFNSYYQDDNEDSNDENNVNGED